MKNQTPVTYEHIGYAIATVAVALTVLSAVAFWIPKEEVVVEDEIKNANCHNVDGTGPLYNCDVVIKCYTHEHSNGTHWEKTCPAWLEQLNEESRERYRNN